MSYNDVVLADLPDFYWRMNDTNTTCVDSGPNGINGTYTGGYTQSQAGLPYQDTNNCVLFNGSTGYVDLGINQIGPILAGATGLTVELLFNLTSTPGVMTIFEVLGSSTGYAIFRVNHAGGNQPRFLFVDPTGGHFYPELNSSIFIVPGKTCHLIATVDLTQSPRQLKLYINGSLASSATDSWAAGTVNSNTPTQSDRIGMETFGGNQFLSGKVDEVAIYKKVLSANRIAIHKTEALAHHVQSLKSVRHAKRSIQLPIQHLGI